MNDRLDDSGVPYDALYEWLRATPDAWPLTETDALPADQLDRMVTQIVSGSRVNDRTARGRRRRRIVAGTIGLFVVSGGAVAATNLIRDGQPRRPEAGITCYAEPQLGVSAVVIAGGQDPIDGCRQQWATGAFADTSDASSVPDLVACVDPDGPIDVFPGDVTTCDRLHLQSADLVLDAESGAVVELQDGLSNYYLEGCHSPAETETFAEQKVDSLHLAGWQVVVVEDASEMPCAATAVDSQAKTVTIIGTDG